MDWPKFRNTGIKLGFLSLTCLLGFGAYFCYDSPAALQTELKQALNLTQAEYMSMYAWYSWPNVFLCFIGGYLVDQVLGRQLGGIIFAGFVLFGQGILAFGVSKRSLVIMDIGRLIFGLGSETLAVTGNAYAVAWFSGSMLNLAFGMVLSVSRLGSTASLNILGPLFHKLNDTVVEEDLGEFTESGVLSETMFIAGIACCMSFVIACLLAFLDKKFHKKVQDFDSVIQCDDEQAPLIQPELVDGFENVEDEDLLDDSLESLDDFEDSQSTTKFFDITEILNFPGGVWLLLAICVFYYSSVFPLISQGVEFFQSWFGVSAKEARMLNSVVYTMSLPCSPIMGMVIDRTKHNVVWVFIAICLTITAHALMACVKWFALTPWVPMIILGLGYSILACSLWPMVSFLVPQKKLATAYGFMQAIQNLGLALTAMLSGVIVDKGGYQQLLMFFISFQLFALIAIIVLWKKHGPNCNPNGPVEYEELDE